VDFARIIEILDRHHTSFVSITQQFNTTTSMGRLTLNILLSFAQFEREIIAERTRDKMSAARRKGKWVGGIPVLGYDVDAQGGRLVVNEDEAARVRAVFDLYLERQSLMATVTDLNRRGWTLKRWTTRKGTEAGGGRFNVAALSRMLGNVTYLGKVDYRGEVFEGEHAAIVEEKPWHRAQALLRRNGSNGGKLLRNRYGALLRGLLYCGSCDAAMTHSISGPKDRRRRYYVCCRAQKEGWESCPTKSVPAGEIEKFVVERIRCIGKDPEVVLATLEKAEGEVKKRRLEVEQEQGLLAKELDRSIAEMNQLIRETARAGEHETPANARLADLQERIRVGEQRATELREEAIALGREKVTKEDVAAALSLFDPVWESLTSLEQASIIQLLVRRVTYDREGGKIAITFQPSGIKTLSREAGNFKASGSR
jgi:site-specific DNA recombinase